MMRRLRILPLLLWALAPLAPDGAVAQVEKREQDTLSSLAFRSDRLQAPEESEPLDAVRGAVVPDVQSAWSRFQLGAPVEWRATVDGRTGLVSFAEGGGIAWIPGKGNSLALEDLSAPAAGARKVSLPVLEAIARDFLPGVAGMMGIDPASLALNAGRSGQPAAHLWLVDFDVMRDGMAIEGARVVFRVNNGNLIQFGTENLPVPGSQVPRAKITRAQALAAVARAIGGFGSADDFRDGGSQHLIPVSGFDSSRAIARVWQFVFRRDGVVGTWRARVDTATGEVLELVDLNDYAQATGGIFLNSPATGSEVVRPMPFTNLSSGGYTNSAGLYNYSGGTVTSTLAGQYVRIVDDCGAISQASDASGDIAFGTSSGTDCATPGHGGAGNTHSARQQFYHVNRSKEVARGWLPSNSWLGQQLTVNVNIPSTCNANWNGSALNFYRSGGGCANTGEIAGVSLHEFGHGLDANDGTGAAPEKGTGEAYGDITAAIALHASCIGPGFQASNCGGYGDPCTSCTGVRDVDWAKRQSNTPATVANFTQSCPAGGGYVGPCGREGHCESYVASQAVWDFVNRDLPNPGSGAAWSTLDRLWFLSRSTATSAFTCNTGGTFTSNGCGAGSWWRTLRAVDDDDGNLSNGTPHGGALFAAFNRHGIACTSDAGASTTFRGCTPPATPTLTATAGDDSASLSWTTSGSAVYNVFRNETGCNAGFTKIVSGGSGASFVDNNVANGTTYYYQVAAFPAGNEACASTPSACKEVTPQPLPPDFTVSCTPSSLSTQPGDDDTTVCKVTSLNGFASSTALSCSGLPAGVTCAFSPGSVTPPAGGNATSTLTVSASGSAAPGTYSFQVRGAGGSLTRSTTLSLTLSAPDFSLTCDPAALTIAKTGSAISTCTAASQGGFAGNVNFACPGAPAGVSCSFTPSSVILSSGGSARTTLTISVSGSAATGPATLKVRGTNAATSTRISLALNIATPVFVDDFETDQGWTVGSGTATAGLWARAVPDVNRWQLPAYTGSFDLVTGPTLLANGGPVDVDGGTTVIRSPFITLPASGTIRISLAYFFAYNTTATADDVFRIRVVGSTTQSIVRLEGGVNPGDSFWRTVSADISAFAGESVRIVIDATDDDPTVNSIVEAAVDNVQVTVQ